MVSIGIKEENQEEKEEKKQVTIKKNQIHEKNYEIAELEGRLRRRGRR
jgi:hypothetical protein